MDDAILAKLQRASDYWEIHQALMRYCRGCDRADEALIKSAYHDDALDNRGNPAPASKLAEVVAGLAQRQMMHFTGNVFIEFEDDDTAFVESYFISYSPVDEDGKTSTRTRAGRYLDRFERRNGEWKIAYRRALDEWARIDEIARLPEHWGDNMGVRGPADDVFHMRERLQ